MTEPTPDPLERLGHRLAVRGEVRSGTVVGFDGDDVVVRLDDDPDVPSGRVPRHELSWRRVEHPSEIFGTGQRITGEVVGADGQGRVLLSAKACECEPLRRFLLGIEHGSVLTGTASSVHSFGVFVRIDGEPAHPVLDGTGFVRVPELSWSRCDHPAEVVWPGQHITGEVLVADTRQGQVSLSLKAPQPDPRDRLAMGVGGIAGGPVTKTLPFGAFVRIAQDVEGLVHVDDLGGPDGRRPADPRHAEARPPVKGNRASASRMVGLYRPTAARRASTRSVRSQVKSGSSRPKWP
ncbi:Polyribonucleotide nucleotidyltransferase [Streptomyces sp. RB17]|uniref:S1 RNA-binding domain-containing protein n=1 Tax=Streptomyces sp. RB17 TaxID=2585197 RepID=UPI00129805FC|nr:S1 RNA-binding domain-containing protein [Streptomyces sp. RB17]MQY39107.1 Polyribonucleotide nucleotidyltransferase [Streptomyces sp. RB17]